AGPLGGHSDDKTILAQAWLNGPAGGHPLLPVTTSAAIQAARLAHRHASISQARPSTAAKMQTGPAIKP
ncbi:MAG TPA: hypothetical protein VEV61_07665, partial [Streptosporangiaceae bacterium]|nr:hypothetical protein [Streptosporangiaceae bacterium]